MIAVIFEVYPAKEGKTEYLSIAASVTDRDRLPLMKNSASLMSPQ